MVKQRPQKILEKLYVGILLVIFGGIVLHAPLSVGFGTLFPNFNLEIKAWKEVLMAIASVVAVILLYQKKQFKLLREPIIMAIGAYIILHLLLLISFNNGLTASVSGLFIDLRYLVFFILVYLAVKMWPDCRNCFVKVGLIGALVVAVFAFLQVFVLPKDILKYIGYNLNTIAPFMTVDQNMDFIRINSTLRGPNPLGAYIVIVLSAVLAFVLNVKFKNNKKLTVILSILAVCGLVALWFNYSRSALVAFAVSAVIILAISLYRKLSLKKWAIIGGLLVVTIGTLGLLTASGNHFISNVLLHSNPNGDTSINSNEGHVDSLKSGFSLMLRQPFGAGVGSTGSASLSGDKPLIIENQYLFIAHEAGWLGLILFLSIYSLVVVKLWKKRTDWLALGVLASGVGLAIIGLMLPVWADDTVSIIWWGLAAVIIGGDYVKSKIKQKSA